MPITKLSLIVEIINIIDTNNTIQNKNYVNVVLKLFVMKLTMHSYIVITEL